MICFRGRKQIKIIRDVVTDSWGLTAGLPIVEKLENCANDLCS